MQTGMQADLSAKPPDQQAGIWQENMPERPQVSLPSTMPDRPPVTGW